MYTPLFFLGIYFLIGIICLSVFIYSEIKQCKSINTVYTLSIKESIWLFFIACIWPLALTIFIGINLDKLGEKLDKHFSKNIIKIDFSKNIIKIDFSKNKVDTSDEWMR